MSCLPTLWPNKSSSSGCSLWLAEDRSFSVFCKTFITHSLLSVCLLGHFIDFDPHKEGIFSCMEVCCCCSDTGVHGELIVESNECSLFSSIVLATFETLSDTSVSSNVSLETMSQESLCLSSLTAWKFRCLYVCLKYGDRNSKCL